MKEVQCNNDLARRMAGTLQNAGINVRAVTALGMYLHIDSYAKYDSKLQHLLTGAGFSIVKVSDGIHMDETHGYRLVAKVKA